MRVKFLFSVYNEKSTDLEKWIELDIIPRIGEWVEVIDILSENEYDIIYDNSTLWSGYIGTVHTVSLRKDENGFYYEIRVMCEEE